MAKEMLRSQCVPFHVVELNKTKGGSVMQDFLERYSGQRTVPNIFINGNHVGGYDQLEQAQASGKLKEMLAACNL